jgi:hypothetical protein
MNNHLRISSVMGLVGSLFLSRRADAQTEARPDAAPDATVTEAKALLKEGRLLAEDQRCTDALKKFERSAEMRPSASASYNIAYCEDALGHYTRARKMYLKALAQNAAGIGTSLGPERVETITKGDLPKVTKKIARVRVMLESSDIAVSVGGRPLEVERSPTSPPSPRVLVAGTRWPGDGEIPSSPTFELLIDPDEEHLFILSREGYEDALVRRRFSSGSSDTLVLPVPKIGKRIPPKRPTHSDTDEVVVIGGAATFIGLGTGIFAGSASKNPGLGIVIGMGLGAAGPIAMGVADYFRTLHPPGLPHSIATGLYVGFQTGMYAGFAMSGDQFTNPRAAGLWWGSSLAGAALGGVLGHALHATPAQASLVLSGGTWTGFILGMTLGGVAGTVASVDDVKRTLAVSGGIGTVTGAVLAGYLARDLSLRRIRFIDLGGFVGTVSGFALSTVVSLATSNQQTTSLGTVFQLRAPVLLGTAAGTALGLVAGTRLTAGMDRNEPRENCAGCGLQLSPAFSPAQGGATFGLTGAF